MKDKDNIKQLFKDKLENFEAPIRPELWNYVASTIGSKSAVASSFFSFKKLLIVSLSISTVCITTNLIVDSTNNKVTKSLLKKQKVQFKNETFIIKFLPKKDKNNTIINQKNVTCLPVFKDDNSLLIDTFLDFVIDEKSLFPLKTKILDQTFIPTKDIIKTPSSLEYEIVTIDSISINNSIVSPTFLLPNVFTPNSDGINDVFEIKNINLSDFSITILNTKNDIVFTSDDVNFVWDGILFNGEVQSGNFLYYIIGKFSDGKIFSKSSPLKILK